MTVALHSAFLNIHRSPYCFQYTLNYEVVSANALLTSVKFADDIALVACLCLAVTCRLHFWQNDRGLLRATAVTRGWNGYRNKSQHRKLILEKKTAVRI